MGSSACFVLRSTTKTEASIEVESRVVYTSKRSSGIRNARDSVSVLWMCGVDEDVVLTKVTLL